MSNKPILFALSFYISLAVLAVYLFFILFTYHKNRILLSENIEKNAVGMGNDIISEVKEKIVITQEITSTIRDQLPYFVKDNKIDKLLLPFFDRYPFIHSIHMDLERSKYPLYYKYLKVSRSGDLPIFQEYIKLTPDCWVEDKEFKILLEDNKKGWSKPFRCSNDSTTVSAYFSPIIINKEKLVPDTIGWISCDLSHNFLNRLIKKAEIGNKGFAFMVSKDGTYISHPDSNKMFNYNILNISQKVVRKNKESIKSALENGTSGSIIGYPEELNYKKAYIHYAPVQENGWMLIFVFPYSELYRDLNYTLAKMVFISILGVMTVLVLVYLITRRIIKPITRVASELHTFSSDDPDFIESVRNETEALIRSLNRLKARYAKIIDIQEKNGYDSKQLTQEIVLASEIQKSIIKTQYPAFPERNDLDIHSVFQPARIISGDLFDYFFIDKNHLLLSVGDVSGKGIPAALFMSVAYTLMRANGSDPEPEKIVFRVNNELCSTNKHQFFLTLFVGILNINTGLLKYCNAAHTRAFILKSQGRIMELDESHGIPLGLHPYRKYGNNSIVLEKDDVIILFTDGITESTDPDGNQFGMERFRNNIRNLKDYSAKEINERIIKSLNIHRNNSSVSDDITLLTIKFSPS